MVGGVGGFRHVLEDWMKRFADEWAVMAKRQRFEKVIHQEWAGHLVPYEQCHCFGKPGLFRKSRPLQRSIRFDRAIWQCEQKATNKSKRREGRKLSRNALYRIRRTSWCGVSCPRSGLVAPPGHVGPASH